jgi:hypothetical protein
MGAWRYISKQSKIRHMEMCGQLRTVGAPGYQEGSGTGMGVVDRSQLIAPGGNRIQIDELVANHYTD